MNILFFETCFTYAFILFDFLKEHLSLLRNNLVSIHGEITALPCLRSLNLRRNKLKSTSVPDELFILEDLNVLVGLQHLCFCSYEPFSFHQMEQQLD